MPAGVIPEYRSKQILKAFDVPIRPGDLVTTIERAQSIAQSIGFRVVLKAQAAALSHKSDVGGVALNLHDAHAVAAAWHKCAPPFTPLSPLVLDGLLVEHGTHRGSP